MTKVSHKVREAQTNALRRYKTNESDVYLKFTLLGLHSIRAGQIHEIVKSGNDILQRESEYKEEYARYNLQRKTVYRKLKMLIEKGEVKKDNYGVYSLTDKGASNIEYFADLFGHVLLASVFNSDEDFPIELPKLVNMYGMYLAYLIILSLRNTVGKPIGNSESDRAERHRISKWLREAADLDGLANMLENSIPIKHEKGQRGDVWTLEANVYENLLTAFRVQFPEFYASAEELRLNFDDFIKNWKEMRQRRGLSTSKW